jgi:uncharacterized UBP type Zn finger protein
MKPEGQALAILLQKSVQPSLANGLLPAPVLPAKDRQVQTTLFSSMLGTNGQKVRI